MFIVFTKDVFFREMIQRTAVQEGEDCLVVEGEETLMAALQEDTPGLLLVDLGVAGLDGVEVIQKLKQNPSTRAVPIIAFGNRLRADLLQDARELGADLVLPKSAFRGQITGIIRQYGG